MPKGEFIIMKKHGLAIFILAAVMTLDSAGMTALAAEGWAQEGNSWVYYNASGSRVYNAWRKGGDGCWRYLDSYGVMASNAWVAVSMRSRMASMSGSVPLRFSHGVTLPK